VKTTKVLENNLRYFFFASWRDGFLDTSEEIQIVKENAH
jgi:hypothetical protein